MTFNKQVTLNQSLCDYKSLSLQARMYQNRRRRKLPVQLCYIQTLREVSVRQVQDFLTLQLKLLFSYRACIMLSSQGKSSFEANFERQTIKAPTLGIMIAIAN